MGFHKKISPFGPADWPAIRLYLIFIYICILAFRALLYRREIVELCT